MQTDSGHGLAAPRHNCVLVVVGCFLLFAGQISIISEDWNRLSGSFHRYQKVHSFSKDSSSPSGPGFTEIPATDSGIRFTNQLASATMARNSNLVNGSGLACGDVDGDGLPDLFLCNLEGRNALFKNLGNWRFEEFANSTSIQLPAALTRGAALADADGDGDLDLFLTFNASGLKCFLNDGKGNFSELPGQAGLSSKNGSTTVALADVDGNGTLDVYLANFGEINVLRDGGVIRYRMVDGKQVATGRFANRLKWMDGKIVEFGEPDTLFLNLGGGRFEAQPWGSNRFLDSAGHPMEAPWDFGLCATLRDFNGDGAPDLYVCNDFQTPDRLWFNDGRGNFQLAPPQTIRRFPYASMGMDAADMDRDGRLDLFVVEMLPSDPAARLRTTPGNHPSAPDPNSQVDPLQVARNVLLWNRGDGTWAEIARFAGVEETDWSWMPVFLDVDLDGFEDLLVTNGHSHNVNDRDLIEGGSKTRSAGILNHPPLVTPNLAFRNLGNRQFGRMSREWGFDSTRLSHGIALADLDADGDLDVVVNCLNQPPLIYRNNSKAPRILVRLKGNSPNTHGIGAKISVRAPGLPEQFQEVIAGGRYLSSDEPARAFAAGTGAGTNLLQIEVLWRSGRKSLITNAPANSIWEIVEPADSNHQPQVTSVSIRPNSAEKPPLFTDIRSQLRHRSFEEPFDESQRQPSAPWRYDRSASALAVGDWNRDGFDDLLIGAGQGRSIQVFPHKSAASGSDSGSWLNNAGVASIGSESPDDITALLMLRSDNQVHLVSALSNHQSPPGTASKVQIRPGSKPGPSVVRDLHASAASIRALAAADFDGNGTLDLFAGSSSVPGRFPESSPSAIVFDCLSENPRSISLDAGRVGSGFFTDLNLDGRPELVTVGPWEPVRIWTTQQGQVTDISANWGLHKNKTTGLWLSGTAADMDGDGRMDLVLGGMGLNSEWTASPASPLILVHGNLSGPDHIDSMTFYRTPWTSMFYPRENLAEFQGFQPSVRTVFPTHASYATAGMDKILAAIPAGKWQTVEATRSAGVLLLNQGDYFEWTELPDQAQWSPARQLKPADFDGDGILDLFVAQNFFSGRSNADRCDSGRGLLLRGLGGGKLEPWTSVRSGIAMDGEQAGAVLLDDNADGRMDLIITQVADETVHLRNLGSRVCLRVSINDGLKNPDGIGCSIRFIGADGKPMGPAHEIRAGAGSTSDSATLLMAYPQAVKRPANPRSDSDVNADREPDTDPGFLATSRVTELEVRWPGGVISRHRVPERAREIRLKRTPEPILVKVR